MGGAIFAQVQSVRNKQRWMVVGVHWLIFSEHSTGWPKKCTIVLCALTLPNINRFSQLFRCQNREKMCSNTITKDPTKPQVRRYTTL